MFKVCVLPINTQRKSKSTAPQINAWWCACMSQWQLFSAKVLFPAQLWFCFGFRCNFFFQITSFKTTAGSFPYWSCQIFLGPFTLKEICFSLLLLIGWFRWMRMTDNKVNMSTEHRNVPSLESFKKLLKSHLCVFSTRAHFKLQVHLSNAVIWLVRKRWKIFLTHEIFSGILGVRCVKAVRVIGKHVTWKK